MRYDYCNVINNIAMYAIYCSIAVITIYMTSKLHIPLFLTAVLTNTLVILTILFLLCRRCELYPMNESLDVFSFGLIKIIA